MAGVRVMGWRIMGVKIKVVFLEANAWHRLLVHIAIMLFCVFLANCSPLHWSPTWELYFCC